MEPPREESQQDVQERQWQEKLDKAHAYFEKHPELAAVLVELHDEKQALERRITDAEKERLSEARMGHCIQLLDSYGKANLRLVGDFESAKHYAVLVSECVRWAWSLFSGVPIQSVPPTPLFKEQSAPPPIVIQRDRFMERAAYWEVEAFRRVASKAQIHAPNVSNRLDELVARLDIRHDELARRIGIGKTTYFAVKAGRGKKSTRLKVEKYVDEQLAKLNKSEPKI